MHLIIRVAHINYQLRLENVVIDIIEGIDTYIIVFYVNRIRKVKWKKDRNRIKKLKSAPSLDKIL